MIDFEKEVIEPSHTQPVLVDFTADWCMPCRAMKPVLKQLKDDKTDLKVVMVDADENRPLLQTYWVRGIPTIMLFHKGTHVGKYYGGPSIARLTEWIDMVLKED